MLADDQTEWLDIADGMQRRDARMMSEGAGAGKGQWLIVQI